MTDAGNLNAILLVLQLVILPVQGWIGITLWRLREQISLSSQTTAVLDGHVTESNRQFRTMLQDHETRIRMLEHHQRKTEA